MRSLRSRLTLWFALAVTVTAGIAASVGYLVVRQQMFAGVDFLLDAEAREIASRLGDAPDSLTDAAIVEALRAHSEIDAPAFFFQIHRDPPGVVFRSKNLGPTVLPDLTGGAPTRTIPLHHERARLLETHIGALHIQVATSLEQLDNLLERHRHALLLGLPILFLVSIGTGFLVGQTATHPVRAMQRSARRISASNLSERLPVPDGRDEIADLARLLNELFGRLERSFDQIRQFTADASHELKTPLSLIRLHAERLARSPRLDAAEHADIDGQIEEIERLRRLIDSLLLLAKADARSLRLDLRGHDTADTVRDFAQDAAALAEDRGTSFAVTRNDGGHATFDAILLRQVLLNLVANALAHAAPGGRVTLESAHTLETWTLAFEDNGPGLPTDQLERIFARFVRGPAAESQAPGGSGLGLAIARSIVEAHQGTVTARNRDSGTGLRVIIHLPHTRT